MARRAAFLVLGVSCYTCAPAIEKSVRKLPGVVNAATNYVMNTIYVDYEPALVAPEAIQRRIEGLGYRVVRRPFGPGSPRA